MTLTKEEIQKQIEAVREQIKFFNLINSSCHEDMLHDEIIEGIEGFRNSLKVLTATLKPHLEEGQQLDV